MAKIGSGVLLIFFLYLIVRYESLEDVWNEIDQYEGKIERNLANTLHNVFKPFNDEVESTFTTLFEEVGLNDQETQANVHVGDGGEQKIEEQSNWDDVMPASPSQMKEQFKNSLDDLEFNPQTYTDGDDPPPTQYLVENGKLDPSEIFANVKKHYKKYRRPTRVLILVKISLLGLIIPIGTILFMSALNMSYPEEIQSIIAGFGVLWILSELLLWKVLDQEVATEGKTPFSKLLEPDPRDLL